MSMFPQQGTLDYGYAETGERTRILTRFFHNVYLWMSIGLVWTGIVSWLCVHTPALQAMMSPGIMMAAGLGAFVIAMLTQSIAMRVGVAAGLGLFMLYASLIGFTIAPIWVVYKQSTIGAAFGLTGGIFFVMSLIGMVTKIDLSRFGAIAMMIVLGLFIASIINFFIASSMISWIITYAVVIIFPLLIAYETQQLKEFALNNTDDRMAGRMAVVGALMLYISFINIFLALLRILGDRE